MRFRSNFRTKRNRPGRTSVKLKNKRLKKHGRIFSRAILQSIPQLMLDISSTEFSIKPIVQFSFSSNVELRFTILLSFRCNRGLSCGEVREKNWKKKKWKKTANQTVAQPWARWDGETYEGVVHKHSFIIARSRPTESSPEREREKTPLTLVTSVRLRAYFLTSAEAAYRLMRRANRPALVSKLRPAPSRALILTRRWMRKLPTHSRLCYAGTGFRLFPCEFPERTEQMEKKFVARKQQFLPVN